ncbi:hypothetical protein [Hydrogenophaga sp. ANAO-22]|uniref:hypothetical protein n=1 Tax=Hydrogenophaga sp. ANAO-22 TaxID=3166645 RepID=UPI0036D39FC1
MKDEQSIEQTAPNAARRQAMPAVAAFVDLCREAYGSDMVDAQMAKAQQAKREHAAVLQAQGADEAARWHVVHGRRCTFFAEEGGRSIGLRSPWGQDAP